MAALEPGSPKPVASRERFVRWLISTEPTRGRRAWAYWGFGPEAWPYRRGWMVRAGNPQRATSRWDRWLGVLVASWILADGVILIAFQYSWLWRVVGVFAVLLGAAILTRVLRAIIRRQPLADDPVPPRGPKARALASDDTGPPESC